MVDTVFHTQKHWEDQQNQIFESMIHKLDTFSSAGQAMMFVMVILMFMIQYYQGQQEWPSYAQSDLANVELYDMQWIENAFDQSVGQTLMHNDVDQGNIVQAYKAANDMLQDLYTNPIFDGSKIPQEVLGNLCTIFGVDSRSVQDGGDVSWHDVNYTVDGQPQTTSVPYFNNSGGGLSEWTATVWDGAPESNGYQPFTPGDPGYQAWFDQMQGIQQKMQETVTFGTNMSSSEQSEENFYASYDKEFTGTFENWSKDVVSLRQTELQNQVRS